MGVTTQSTHSTGLQYVDHCVGNALVWSQMNPWVQFTAGTMMGFRNILTFDNDISRAVLGAR